MVLYVDETENDKYFIVAGLLSESTNVILEQYKHFKHKIKKFNLSQKDKQRLFTEFKSTLLDNDFQRIKRVMLKEVSSQGNLIYYSCYTKSSTAIKQSEKEFIYITLLIKIINEIPTNSAVVFDAFKKPDFEEKIKQNVLSTGKVSLIEARDSQTECGLQFIDNICSSVRLYKSNDEKSLYYKLIAGIAKEI